jgi:SfnB family sulfur acquisition oxidoreductase
MATHAPAITDAYRLGSEEEALIAARQLAETLASGAPDRDRAGAVPHDDLRQLDGSGLLGITIPREYGGPGLGASTLAEVVRTLAAADPAIAQIPQGHFLFVDVLRVWGSPHQKERLFWEVLAGRRLGNALAERGAQHAQDLKTRLTRHGEGLRLNGRKYYCTGASTARWIAVSALDEQDRLVVAFVRRDDDGVRVDDDWNAMGQRATASGTTHLDNVHVDPALVIEYWRAFEGPQLLGAHAQLVHAAIEVGIAGGALHDGREFVLNRARPFFEAVRGGWAQTAAQDPHTIQRFGRLATQVRAAEELLRWAAFTLDDVGAQPIDEAAAARGSIAVAQAKAFASEIAVHVASDLFSMTGTSGTDERHNLDRHWRNARTHSVHDPVDWKYHHVGNYLLGGELPPNHGQL